MAKVEILGFAAGLPRTDLARHRPGSAEAAASLVQRLFPGRIGAPLPPADVLTASYPEYGRIYAATFGDTGIVCGQDLVELVDLPSAAIADPMVRNVFRIQINGVVDSAAVEILSPDGETVRELMLVADAGVIADIGPQLDFEKPFWAGARDPDGAHAAINGAEMPFDVVDFGEEALRTLFGFVVDPNSRSDDLDPRRIILHGFVIAADSGDPSDMAQARSGGPVPALPDDLAPAPGRPRLREPSSSDHAGGGSGDRPTAETAGPTDRGPAESWWQRVKRRLFG